MKATIKPGQILLTIFAIVFAMGPLLKYYDFPGTTFSLTSVSILIMAILGFLWGGRKSMYIKGEMKTYFALVLYTFIIYIIASLASGEISKIYVFFFIFLQLFIILTISQKTEFDVTLFEKFKKIYITICAVLTSITILEVLIWLAMGQIYIFKLPFPLMQEYAKLGYRFGYNGRGTFIGFSPFFTEPSHFAQYLVPAVCILLNDIRRGKGRRTNKIVQLGMIVMSTLISTSTFGLATLFAILIYYAVIGKGRAVKILRKLLVFGCVVAVICTIIFGVQNNLLSYGISNLVEGFSSGNDKTTYRIFRGVAYFVQFPVLLMIFGVGFSNFSYTITNLNLSYKYEIISDNVVMEYLNGASQALIYSGVIGLLLLIFFICTLLKKTNNESKVLVLALILLFLTVSTFLRGISVFYIAIIIMLHNYDELLDRG